MVRVVVLLVVGILGFAFLIAAPRPAIAQMEEPPALGAVVFEDPLTAPSAVLAPWQCATGQGSADFAGEGYVMRVAGGCSGPNGGAFVPVTLSAVGLQDGEIRAEVKLLSGGPRAGFYFTTRSDEAATTNYFSMIFPASRSIRIGYNAPGKNATLSDKSGADVPLKPEDWNTFAVRMAGPKIWLIVNDQNTLMVEDSTADGRVIRLNVRRIDGPGNDETAFVVRNLRISALKDGDPARAPTYAP